MKQLLLVAALAFAFAFAANAKPKMRYIHSAHTSAAAHFEAAMAARPMTLQMRPAPEASQQGDVTTLTCEGHTVTLSGAPMTPPKVEGNCAFYTLEVGDDTLQWRLTDTGFLFIEATPGIDSLLLAYPKNNCTRIIAAGHDGDCYSITLESRTTPLNIYHLNDGITCTWQGNWLVYNHHEEPLALMLDLQPINQIKILYEVKTHSITLSLGY